MSNVLKWCFVSLSIVVISSFSFHAVSNVRRADGCDITSCVASPLCSPSLSFLMPCIYNERFSFFVTVWRCVMDDVETERVVQTETWRVLTLWKRGGLLRLRAGWETLSGAPNKSDLIFHYRDRGSCNKQHRMNTSIHTDYLQPSRGFKMLVITCFHVECVCEGVYKCVCGSVYVSEWVCVGLWVNEYLSEWKYVCGSVWVSEQAREWVCKCVPEWVCVSLRVWVGVCVCVSEWVCKCVCVSLCAWVSAHMFESVCLWVWVIEFVRVCVGLCVCECVLGSVWVSDWVCVSVWVFVSESAAEFASLWVCTWLHVCEYMCKSIRVCARVSIYVSMESCDGLVSDADCIPASCLSGYTPL